MRFTALFPENFTVDVPALNVRLVDGESCQDQEVLVISQVPLPIVMARTLATFDDTLATVTLKLFALKVHLVIVSVLVVVRLSRSVIVPLGAFSVIPWSTDPHFQSIVKDHLPSNVKTKLVAEVKPEIIVKDQNSEKFTDVVQVKDVVQVAPVQLILFQARGISCVTV